MSEYRDYENGVADVLAFLADGSATVDRNVRLPSRSGGRQRQIDVRVRGRIFGMANATLVVDCKRRRLPIDVKDVEAFIGLVEDVGADVGMMVTTEGSTEGARDRARAVRGVHLEVMSLEELVAWSPVGTVTTTYRLPADRQTDAEKVLPNAGFRVAPDAGFLAGAGEVVLRVIRHYGTKTPSGEMQQDHMTTAEAALGKIGVEPIHVAHGIVAGGRYSCVPMAHGRGERSPLWPQGPGLHRGGSRGRVGSGRRGPARWPPRGAHGHPPGGLACVPPFRGVADTP